MIGPDTDVVAHWEPWRQAVSVYARRRVADKLHVLCPADQWREIDREKHESLTPSLELSEEAAQSLCDALASAGIRPSTETRAEQKATQAHLEDLRRIAFKGLKIEGDSS